MYKSLFFFVLCLSFSQQAITQMTQPVTAILGAYGAEIDLLLEKTENKKQLIIEHLHFTEGTLNGRKVVIAARDIARFYRVAAHNAPPLVIAITGQLAK